MILVDGFAGICANMDSWILLEFLTLEKGWLGDKVGWGHVLTSETETVSNFLALLVSDMFGVNAKLHKVQSLYCVCVCGGVGG